MPLFECVKFSLHRNNVEPIYRENYRVMVEVVYIHIHRDMVN